MGSPYIITRSEGLAHVRLASAPAGQCLGCCRLDVYEMIRAMVVAEVREMVERQVLGTAKIP